MTMNESSDMELVERHVQALGEHFDTVQIFCTRHEPYEKEGTVSVNLGEGNWHARYGQVAQWMIRQDHFIRKDADKGD